MKKFLAFAFVALTAIAPLSARELKFYNGDTPVESGSRLEFTNYNKTSIGNGMVEVSFEPDLYLWSDIFTNTVTLTANCVSGQAIQLCAGGDCVSAESVTKENIKLTTNQKLFLQFEYIAELGENEVVPEVVTEISAVDTKYENIKADITVVLNSSSGVTSIYVNDSSFKAVAGAISYDFASLTEVNLYSLSGERILTSVVEGCGQISTTALASGLYLYKAGNKSGKIYIR